jgi:hypothetical protein
MGVGTSGWPLKTFRASPSPRLYCDTSAWPLLIFLASARPNL